jgi:hypothetical protein
MTILLRMRIRRLAKLVRRSDAGKLYRWAPPLLAVALRRRFIRQFARHRSAVMAVLTNAEPAEPAPPRAGRAPGYRDARGVEPTGKVVSARSR